MAVLVTGVGYIGAALVEMLLDQGEQVVAIDNLFSTDLRVIDRFKEHPKFTFIEGDVAEVEVLHAAFDAAPVSTVYSLAAQSSAHPDAASAEYTERTNLIAPRLLLDCMVEAGVGTIVFGSSFRVYGQDLPPVVTESAPYGAFTDLSHLSKVYVEKLMEMYALTQGLTCISLRIGIVYGVGPVMKDDPRFMTAPNKFARQAVQGEPIELHPGTNRPAGFIHVRDTAAAMIEAASSNFSGYVPINAVTEMVSVAAVARAVESEAERRGIKVQIRGLGSRLAGESASVRVESRLAPFFTHPQRTISTATGELLDYFGG